MSFETLHPAPEELFAYRDGELPAERRTLVETHVLACRACRELMDENSKLEAALRARPDDVGDAYYERMQGQVMAKVHAAAASAPARGGASRGVLELQGNWGEASTAPSPTRPAEVHPRASRQVAS